MFHMLVVRVTALLVAIVLGFSSTCTAQKAQKNEFRDWPVASSPREIGKKVAERFVAMSHTNFGRPTPPTQITYPEAVAWYGALTFAEVSGDRELKAQLIKRFEPLFRDEAGLIPAPDHVDNTVFAIVPLEIYLQTKEQRYLDLGKRLADKQWEDPQSDGLTAQTRYWVDDMYMITMAQLQAFRATNDAKYLNRAALEMSAYLSKLQQPSGLFYHAPDVPFYWSRGDGWMAAGMTEMLRDLPANHPQRPQIVEGYKKMMEALLKYQDKQGLWHELIDDADAWQETSSTAMFTFAMVTGVKNGWLNEKRYGPAARKGWLGLITLLDSNGDLRNVCQGTGKQNDKQYYLDRHSITGDQHGQAPVMWCATALLR
jgi:unsaturated rhamnogalacturonyl hydrolase